jgi:hypothetical protein
MTSDVKKGRFDNAAKIVARTEKYNRNAGNVPIR